MAITVGIFSSSGSGKTTSIVVNPDGKCVYLLDGDPNKAEQYEAMNPETTVFINGDKKRPPFPLGDKWIKGKNYFETADTEAISTMVKGISAKGTNVKSIIIDTVNNLMLEFEMMESKKLTFDKWNDLSKQIFALISDCNALRDDLIVYFAGHVNLYTDVDGNESKCLTTNGRKLEKIKLESKLPIVLFGTVERGTQGDNKFFFETQQNRSTGKTPLGMFKDFLIPNSLKLVDDTIRKYYGIE